MAETTVLTPTGRFHWWCHDARGRLRWRSALANGVTFEGVNEVLNRSFRGAAQSPWYCGLIDQSGFSAVANTDQHTSHAGWSEFTGYSGGLRPAWNPVGAVGGIMATGPGSSFGITGSGTLRGVFLASQAPTGTGAGAVLYCTAITTAGGVVPVAPSDTITVTYVCRIAGG